MMRCSEVMSSEIVCCAAVDTVDMAAALMKTHNIGSVPIVSDKQAMNLVGIVTDRDLALHIVAERRNPLEVMAQDVMSTALVTCQPDEDVQRALQLMAQHQVRRIPIVGANNQLVGMISQADIALRIPNEANTGEVVEKISQP